MQKIDQNMMMPALQQRADRSLQKRSASSGSFDRFLKNSLEKSNNRINQRGKDEGRQPMNRNIAAQSETPQTPQTLQNQASQTKDQTEAIQNLPAVKDEKVLETEETKVDQEMVIPENWQELPADELLSALLQALKFNDLSIVADTDQDHVLSKAANESELLAKSLLDMVKEFQDLMKSDESSHDEIEKGLKELLHKLQQELMPEEGLQKLSQTAKEEQPTVLAESQQAVVPDTKQEIVTPEKSPAGMADQKAETVIDLTQASNSSNQQQPDQQGKEQRQSPEPASVTINHQGETLVQMTPNQVELWLSQNSFVQELDHQKEHLQQDVTQQLMQKIQVIHSKNESQVTMQLIPENLGKLTIQLVANQQNGLTARIYAETQQARDLIESNFGQLRDALSGKGVNLSGLEVFVGQDPESSDKQRAFQFQQARQRRRLNKAEMSEGVSGLTTAAVQMESHNPYLTTGGFDQVG
ncbi:flagellar hook-length control protein FliK [Anoxynatronum buryatiense]|uniref:Flagellar hook-length control protein FliK n=1 Tax=Anoxynatronum buryatiense TaxID=489973 RepID=A0AA45WUI3_9CLOT|nr:flagellar hook-length control protein FliK [Anoxynatronum buryatiense]SMP47238.1 Flagellar hook-length control protein FliK [Anoxynatronum buryatiense]